MEGSTFHWGEAIDEMLKHIHAKTLIDVCRSIPSSRRLKSKGNTRKDLYDWLVGEDESNQKRAYQLFQQILTNPTKKTCKTTWVLKRKREDEDITIRNVRTRLDTINNALLMNGMFAFLCPVSKTLDLYFRM